MDDVQHHPDGGFGSDGLAVPVRECPLEVLDHVGELFELFGGSWIEAERVCQAAALTREGKMILTLVHRRVNESGADPKEDEGLIGECSRVLHDDHINSSLRDRVRSLHAKLEGEDAVEVACARGYSDNPRVVCLRSLLEQREEGVDRANDSEDVDVDLCELQSGLESRAGTNN